jgi:hypothetical protein
MSTPDGAGRTWTTRIDKRIGSALTALYGSVMMLSLHEPSEKPFEPAQPSPPAFRSGENPQAPLAKQRMNQGEVGRVIVTFW